MYGHHTIQNLIQFQISSLHRTIVVDRSLIPDCGWQKYAPWVFKLRSFWCWWLREILDANWWWRVRHQNSWSLVLDRWEFQMSVPPAVRFSKLLSNAIRQMSEKMSTGENSEHQCVGCLAMLSVPCLEWSRSLEEVGYCTFQSRVVRV